MSDTPEAETATAAPQAKKLKLPPQSSPQDTSNWDDREFTTPVGRVIIETREDAVNDTVIAE